MRRDVNAASFALGVVAIALLAVLVRLRFLDVPLSVDEGGYAAVARFWASGSHLYRDVWVDRPQGLLLLYRGAFDLFGPHAWAVRALATVWGAGLASVVALLVARVADRRTGLVAGALVAVLSVGPRIEGFAANGELLSALPAASALLVFAIWLEPQARRAPARSRCARRLRGPRQAVGLRRRRGDRHLARCSPPGATGFPRRQALRAIGLVAIGAAVPRAPGGRCTAPRPASTAGGSPSRSTGCRSRASRPDRCPIARTCSGRRS